MTQLNIVKLRRNGSGMRWSHIQLKESGLLFDFRLFLGILQTSKSDTVLIGQRIHTNRM